MKIKSIKIDEIELSNFMTFDNYKMSNLSDYNIIFICGKNAYGKSTLTSESIFFTFFNKSLRYDKFIDLLSWGYDINNIKNDTFSKIKLSILDEKNDKHILSLQRNIINNSSIDRCVFDVSENDTGIFDGLYTAKNITSFNNELKELLDIDESIFTLLFLKSPFSQVIFDSNSELLSKITKSQYINELRNDFIKISNDIKLNINNIKSTITKQKDLIESIKSQLDKIIKEEDYNNNKTKLEKLIQEIVKYENEIKKFNNILFSENKKQKVYNAKREEINIFINKINTKIEQLQIEKEKLLNLIKVGNCPTCKQKISNNLYTNEIDKIDNVINELTEKRDENKERLGNANNVINELNSLIDNYINKKDEYNDKLRNVSNIKYSIEQIIKNYDENKKVNDNILINIKRTILDLEDELSILETDFKVISSISKVLLAKNSEYINIFYNNKIANFTLIFKSILVKLTSNKFYDVKIMLNNKPILNDNIQYKSLSTSEKKIVDISFVISYIIYLSLNLKFKVFILDEFFDNYDKENIIHIYNTIYDIAKKYDLQLIITSNKSDYLFDEIEKEQYIKVIDL